MLITNLIYELRLHKIKIFILFIFLLFISVLIIKFGHHKYIKQIIYVDIKDAINFSLNKKFDDPNIQFDTNDQITIKRYENEFMSPAYEYYSLDLNKNNFYLNLLEIELAKKITGDYRPGYNILAYYNNGERRYEITVQLFDDETTFNIVINQIVNGIRNYFDQEDFKNNLDKYFSETKNKFDSFQNSIDNYYDEYSDHISSIEKIIQNAKHDLKLDKFKEDILEKHQLDQYIKDREMNVFYAKQVLKNLENILTELNLKKNDYKSHFDVANFYEISLSDRKTEIRGTYPEYVIALFIILFLSISFFISYFSLIRKK